MPGFKFKKRGFFASTWKMLLKLVIDSILGRRGTHPKFTKNNVKYTVRKDGVIHIEWKPSEEE